MKEQDKMNVSELPPTEFEAIIKRVKKSRNDYLPLLEETLRSLPLDQRAEQRNVFIDGISAATQNMLQIPTITNERRLELLSLRVAFNIEFMIYLQNLIESLKENEKKKEKEVVIN